MKTFALRTSAITLAWLAVSATHLLAAPANTNGLPVTFQITAAIQKTSATTNGTLITATETATPLTIDSQYFLNLLQTEFSTTFPAGAQLAYRLDGVTNGFSVVDQTGSPILDVSTNAADASYVFNLSNNVVAASVSFLGVITGKGTEDTVTSNITDQINEFVPDSGIFYHDAHGNDFHMDGVLTAKIKINTTSGSNTQEVVSFSLVGAGGGIFLNPNTSAITTGTFTKAKFSAKGNTLIE